MLKLLSSIPIINTRNLENSKIILIPDEMVYKI